MKHAWMTLALLVMTSCLPKDPLCQPCEGGGCGEGLSCALTTSGASVCVPAGGSAASCGLAPAEDAGVEPDAGQTEDAGALEDAGAPPDAGTDAGVAGACPAAGQAELTWIYSAYADLCMTKTEITVPQFELCITSTCTDPQNYNDWFFPGCNLNDQAHRADPMNCANLEAAQDFCRMVGARLPTEEEWYAEASAAASRTFPWGEEAATCARAAMREGDMYGCGADGTLPTCSKPAGNSASGLCDMAGNVWEYTSNVSGANVALRGGSWLSTAPYLEATARFEESTDGRYDHIGFRCVVEPL